jgi:hypothetical protein
MPSNNFGFNLPSHLGTLSYSLSASELMETGAGEGSSVETSTALSGNLAFLSKSEDDPFSVVYSGGYIFSALGGSDQSTVYQNLAASQVYRTKSWVYVASDSVNYLPGAPTTGLSGVAGVGDVGVFPVQTGIGPDQSILTTYSNRVGNGLVGSATWQVTPSMNLEGSGSWQLLHFTGVSNPGLNSNQYLGTFGPNFRIDARNSVGADAYYSRTDYPAYAGYVIESDGINVNFDRAWTRRLSTSISVGPETTHGRTFETIPSRVDFAGSGSVTYATRTTGLFASYARTVNSGAGVIFGALSDSLTAGLSRPLSRDWSLGLNVTYSHSTGLAPLDGVTPRYDTVFGAAQVSRRLTEALSAYASYTAIDQSYNNPNGINALSGLNHIFAIGITFAPAPLISAR